MLRKPPNCHTVAPRWSDRDSPKLRLAQVDVCDMLLGRSKVLTERSELFSAASAALWFQREALEELLFTLVTEQLILTSAPPGGSTELTPRSVRPSRLCRTASSCAPWRSTE